MKAVLCTHFGGPDDLEFADLPDPHPEAGQAVVAVKAAALNFFDTLLIAGKYQVKPPFPFSPAAELAGVVEAVAADVTNIKVGDRVIAHPGHGAARQRLA
ncbi:MAG: alcohol dehydrogenase catalytic domain-containing protein, partial [Rhizobiales bacterium]|nr:alcohol dehydrogenase catalytic domain-containing protein [Hyphomicrobiales bacterium]